MRAMKTTTRRWWAGDVVQVIASTHWRRSTVGRLSVVVLCVTRSTLLALARRRHRRPINDRRTPLAVRLEGHDRHRSASSGRLVDINRLVCRELVADWLASERALSMSTGRSTQQQQLHVYSRPAHASAPPTSSYFLVTSTPRLRLRLHWMRRRRQRAAMRHRRDQTYQSTDPPRWRYDKKWIYSVSVAEWLACWTQAQKARVQIAVATLSGNSLRQTAHTHCVSVHQAAKLVAAVLGVAVVTAGLAESNGSLPSGLWLTSPSGWLPRTGISSGTLRSVIEYGLPLPFYSVTSMPVAQKRCIVGLFCWRYIAAEWLFSLVYRVCTLNI